MVKFPIETPKKKIITYIKEKISAVSLRMEAILARESGKILAKLGGTEKKLGAIPRRKSNQ